MVGLTSSIWCLFVSSAAADWFRRFVLMTRIDRYSSFEHEEKHQLETEVYRQIAKRDGNATNFIEVTTPKHPIPQPFV